MPVYFIPCGNKVKIGYARDVDKRLAALQIGNPNLLRVRAMCPGGQREEAEYHRRFAPHRASGEWFHRVPEIIEEMKRLREAHREEFGFL